MRLFSALFVFVSTAAMFSCTMIAEEPLPRAFYLDGGLGAFSQGPEILLYEAARSDEFQSVQIVTRYSQQNDSDERVVRTTVFDLRSVLDFDRCANAALPKHERLANINMSHSEVAVLFQPDRFDHELVEGRCVLAYPIDTPTAKLKVSVEAWELVIQNVESGSEVARTREMTEFWEVFGSARPISLDLWSHDGMERRPDEAADESLVQAIEAGGAMQRAALNVIARRMSLKPFKASDGSIQYIQQRTPDTSDAVVSAILKSRSLVDPEVQWLALAALIAIAPRAHSEEILSQLFEALDQLVLDQSGIGEKAWRARVAATVGDDAFERPEGQPAYKDQVHLSQASELVLVMEGDAPKLLASRYEAEIRRMVLDDLIVDAKIIELAALSPFRDHLVVNLLNKVDSDQFTPPPIQSRLEELLTGGSPIPEDLAKDIARRCDQPASIFPAGDILRAKEFCEKHFS